jgi:hypothetical protein
MSNKINIPLFLLIFFLCTSEAYSHNTSIKISLSLSKSEYYEGESIVLFVIFKNTGSMVDSVDLWALFNLDRQVSIKNEMEEFAKQMEWILVEPDVLFLGKDEYKTLKSGEYTIQKLNVNTFLGYGIPAMFHIGVLLYFPEGKYTVSCLGKSLDFDVLHTDGYELKK